MIRLLFVLSQIALLLFVIGAVRGDLSVVCDPRDMGQGLVCRLSLTGGVR